MERPRLPLEGPIGMRRGAARPLSGGDGAEAERGWAERRVAARLVRPWSLCWDCSDGPQKPHLLWVSSGAFRHWPGFERALGTVKH